MLKDEPNIIKDGDHSNIEGIMITAYEPAYGIIGDPAKKDPHTRQSADHSMAYIIASILKNALKDHTFLATATRIENFWKNCMLTPFDYSRESL